MKRTTIDFSKHIFFEYKTEKFNQFSLQLPDTIIFNITFTNIAGVCVVTGDFGNWVFCREFWPTIGGGVSEQYWCEKLECSSVQKATIYSSTETAKDIESLIAEHLEEHNSDVVNYLNDCLLHSDNEHDYISFAYDVSNYPPSWCSEDVPFGEEVHPQLLCVFDAFEEMCQRIKNQQNEE